MNCISSALLAGLFFVPASLVFGKGDLAGDVKSGGIWKQPWKESKLMVEEHAQWVSKGESVRVAKPSFTLGTVKVGETIFQLKDEKLQEIVFSIYNRGDDGNTSRDIFNRNVEKTKKAVDEALGVEGKPYKPSRADTAVKIEGYQWAWPEGNVLIEYSISNPSVKNFTAEFLRLTVTPKGAAATTSSAKSGKAAKITKASLKTNVQTKEDGTVYIKDIPMVDQGSKGYCAAAATARVLGYYGIDMDQHEVAQLGKSDASKGTNPNVMLKEIGKAISGRFGMGIKTFESIDSVRDILTIARIYNREAKKMDKRVVSTEGPVLDIGEIFSSFDPEALLAARAANKSRVDNWVKTLKGYIDQGVPVLWGVQLGLYPEQEELPQGGGGHLRLIIGYNEKDQTLIFSDSWGVGHEFKTIQANHAMAMTTHLDAIFPRQ